VPKNVFDKVRKGRETIQRGETISIEELKKEEEWMLIFKQQLDRINRINRIERLSAEGSLAGACGSMSRIGGISYEFSYGRRRSIQINNC